MTYIVDTNLYRATIVTYKDVGYKRLSQLYLKDVEDVLKRLKDSGHPGILLQTCNRIELYTYDSDPSAALSCFDHGANFVNNSKVIEGFEVFRHLTRVVCGLESMAVGEHQIAGQVRKCYGLAKSIDAANPPLQLLFDEALRIGKKVRSEVAFERAIDYVSSAVKILSKKLPRNATIAVIGTGDTAKEAIGRLKVLKNKDFDIYLLGRNIDKTNSLAKVFGVNPLHLRELQRILASVDGLIVATSANEYLIRREHLSALPRRTLIVDLSIPPNVDPSVAGSNVELYTMENLSEIVRLNQEFLKDEIRKAEGIVNQELDKLYAKLQNSIIEAVIAKIYKTAEVIRNEEVEEALKRIEQCDPCHKEEISEVISALSWSLIKKLFHHHADVLRRLALQGELDDKTMSLIIKLFLKGD